MNCDPERTNLDNLLKTPDFQKFIVSDKKKDSAFCIQFLKDQFTDNPLTGIPVVDSFFIERFIVKLINNYKSIYNKEELAREKVRIQQLVQCWKDYVSEKDRVDSRKLATLYKCSRERMEAEGSEEMFQKTSNYLDELLRKTLQSEEIEEEATHHYSKASILSTLWAWIRVVMGKRSVEIAKAKFYDADPRKQNVYLSYATHAYMRPTYYNIIIAMGLFFGIRNVWNRFKKWRTKDTETELVFMFHSINRFGKPVMMSPATKTKVSDAIKSIFDNWEGKGSIKIFWGASVYDPNTHIRTMRGRVSTNSLPNIYDLQKIVRRLLAVKYGLGIRTQDKDLLKVLPSQSVIHIPIYNQKIIAGLDCENDRSLFDYSVRLKNYYTILGLDVGASEIAIKNKITTLKKKYSPSKHRSEPEKRQLYREVEEAGDVLLNPSSRKTYLKQLKMHGARGVVAIRKKGKNHCFRFETLKDYLSGKLKPSDLDDYKGCRKSVSGKVDRANFLLWIPGIDIWVDPSETLNVLQDSKTMVYDTRPQKIVNIEKGKQCTSDSKKESSSEKVYVYQLIPTIPEFNSKGELKTT